MNFWKNHTALRFVLIAIFFVIGLTLTLVHILGIYFTGTSVNPARSFGPALFAGGDAWSQLWIFIVAPLAGGVLAALVYGFLASDKPLTIKLPKCKKCKKAKAAEETDEVVEGAEVIEGAEVAAVFAITKVAALAYLMFNLFTPPCFAALGAMNSEINDRKWFWGGVALQFGTGYVVAFLVYQGGTLITEGTLGKGFLPGLAAIAVFAGIIGWLCAKADSKQPVRR